jgi:gas vesicle protein
MSQQDNFSGGFVLGAILGGVVGGVIGVVLASRSSEAEPSLLSGDRTEDNRNKAKKRPLRAATGQNIEVARRSLEDKIAQLNDAIDDVRQQLNTVNGNAKEAAPIDSLTEDR